MAATSAYKTSIAILGAGPAGMVLGNILRRQGIDCIAVDSHSREDIYARGRAGLIESTVVAQLKRHGLADTLLRQGSEHDRCEFRFPDFSVIVEYGKLADGDVHYVYPQNDLVYDLQQMYLGAGGDVRFGWAAKNIRQREDGVAVACVSNGGETMTIEADFAVGCDGYHGVARACMPSDAVSVYNKQHPYGWLAVLAKAPPSTEHIIYALHPDGFAGHMLRSHTVSRYYLQVPLDEDVNNWPDARVWAELEKRLAKRDWALKRGEIVEKRVLAMRSYVMEPMRHRRLFVAGDAAHIITPCGAKGMNLAIQDVVLLAELFGEYYRGGGDDASLDRYSRARLPMIWRAQEFSHSMLVMLHKPPIADPQDARFMQKLNESKLAQLVTSETYKRDFSRNYVGII
jgi:p-hydroxybenzoate 3-monooxygenase